jgi:ribose-phosphate pyrophosphokinase
MSMRRAAGAAPAGLRFNPLSDFRVPAHLAMQNDRNLLVFSGNANRPLAEAVCRELGIRLGKALVGRFSDGEVQVEIEENVRRQEVFVIQPTNAPTAENFMELLVLVDALKRASVSNVTAVVPYFGYARQDRRPRSSRVPITAKVAAKMFGAVGTDRVLTVDLHADQIQGFFDIPVDNVYASPLLLADIWRAHGTDNLIVVSPDVGGVVRARALAKRLDDAELAIIDKRRPRANVATVMNIIGDVAGKTCVLVDDIVDTAGTLCAAAAALKEHGAIKVVAYCTHPVLSGAAISNVTNSQLDELVVTDTICLSEAARACPKIRQLSVAELLAETIRRVAFGESVSSLYVD